MNTDTKTDWFALACAIVTLPTPLANLSEIKPFLMRPLEDVDKSEKPEYHGF
jgi:hypothetical protein